MSADGVPPLRRRQVLVAGAAGLAGSAAVASPAIAQAAPELRWQIASGFPASLDIPAAGAELFARRVGEATDGRFQIRVVPPAEGAGPSAAMDAVAAGSAEMAYATPAASFDRDPVYGLLASVPFGLNTRGTNAWLLEGGGLELANAFLSRQGLRGLPAGNTGARMGGWFRREVKGPADLKGLKVRATGLAGPILKRLGAEPVSLAPGEIAGALERGTLDAAGWTGPYEDEKLGLAKAAPFYYYPGWSEPSSTLFALVNARAWDALPKGYRTVLELAAAETNLVVTARYDVRNPAALRRVAGGGAKLLAFPQDVLEAAFTAAAATYDELSAANADFKTIWGSMRALRADEYLWFQVNEYTYDNFMIRARARGAL